MRYLKTFEDLDFSRSSLMTTRDFLNIYYQCDNCNALFKTFNKEIEKCPHCSCPKPNILSEDEYYDKVESSLKSGEIEDIEKERSSDRVDIIDMPALFNREKNKRNYN